VTLVSPPIDRPHRLSRAGAVGILSGGVGAAAAGAVLLGLGRSAASRVEDPEPGASWSSLADDYDHARIRSGVGYGLLAVGVAATGLGLGLALRHYPEAPVRAVIAPTAARIEVSF
jgi:hypothetical protein